MKSNINKIQIKYKNIQLFNLYLCVVNKTIMIKIDTEKNKNVNAYQLQYIKHAHLEGMQVIQTILYNSAINTLKSYCKNKSIFCKNIKNNLFLSFFARTSTYCGEIVQWR